MTASRTTLTGPGPDPEKAARRLVEIANSVEVAQGLRPEILTRNGAGQAKSLARAERDKA